MPRMTEINYNCNINLRPPGSVFAVKKAYPTEPFRGVIAALLGWEVPRMIDRTSAQAGDMRMHRLIHSRVMKSPARNLFFKWMARGVNDSETPPDGCRRLGCVSDRKTLSIVDSLLLLQQCSHAMLSWD